MAAYSKQLAEIYDAIVYGKDEAYAETEELIFLVNYFNSINAKKILDLGCGVGKHLVPLASLGYEITGVDISKAVLDECACRLKKRNLSARLIAKSADAIDFLNEFDAVISMDSIFHYFRENEQIINALRKARGVLNNGGEIIIENRNLIADIEYYREPKVEFVKTEKMEIEYVCQNKFDDENSLFYVDINAKIKKNGKNTCFAHSEILRYISPDEMREFLKEAGFKNINFLPDFQQNKSDENEIISFVFIAKK